MPATGRRMTGLKTKLQYDHQGSDMLTLLVCAWIHNYSQSLTVINTLVKTKRTASQIFDLIDRLPSCTQLNNST